MKPASPEPMVSIILPVRNEGRSFECTLERVHRQDYPAEKLEILVVDGMSNDATRDVVRDAALRDPRVRLLDNPGRIVPTAMNIGIASARGEILVRVDGHTLIEEDYVRRCVEALRSTKAECTGGKMTPRGNTFFGRLVAAATSGPFGVGDSHFHYCDEAMFTESAYMGAWPRQVLLDLGGFDEEMVRNQDDELNYRLRKGGGRVYLDPAIRSVYEPRGSLRTLFSQYFQYGYWKIRVFQKHPSMLRARHFVPALFVVSGSAAALGAITLGRAGRAAFGLAVVVYLAAGWLAASRTRDAIAGRWAMPIVFLTIHSAYGLGFLSGAVKFLPKWFVSEAQDPVR